MKISGFTFYLFKSIKTVHHLAVMFCLTMLIIHSIKVMAQSAGLNAQENDPFKNEEFKKSNKKALLIGVGDYEYDDEWGYINAKNDIKLLWPPLKDAGFGIVTRINEQASHKGITQAFLSLLKACNKGDMVLVHLSGHGQQISSKESLGEPDEDPYTEAFAAWDARPEYIPGVYEGNAHLTDDEINFYMSLIRNKIGESGYLMISVDACHSGSMCCSATLEDEEQEEDDIIRGASMPIVIPNYKPKKRNKLENMSPALELSACQSYQFNHEYKDIKGRGYGSLSYLMYLSLQEGFTDFMNLTNYVMNNYKSCMKKDDQEPFVEFYGSE